MKKINWSIFLFAAGMVQANAQQAQNLREKTSFQVSAPYNPAYDVRSDIAIVYGVDSSFETRVKDWRGKGYNVQFMTGIAWGEYKDYFKGRWDGINHIDEESQVERNGKSIGHGVDIPYLVPTESFVRYFKTVVKRAIDAGVTAVYLEEPEFWARAGYSTAFKREWQKYYGTSWQAQHESPEATYLSSKLKYHLYHNALKEVFSYIHAYSDSIGRKVQCYVPTHSLLNYSSWNIVSPEASLASLEGMSGYIAQVWTGTAREPNFYNGLEKERVFETAFLEYGSMLSMTAPTKRRMYFLTDPIEDWPRTWDDYKRNYQATFTAKLLYPSVTHFEVMPWPNRIYQGKFKLENSDERQPISPAYATQMQVMVNALNKMPGSTTGINGSKGIGVLVGNSMMFQRFPTHNSYEDPQLSNFYGMILPLLKLGIPVETVHMENLAFEETLKHIKVLVMSYAGMKPLSQEVNEHLAKWVKNGGVLLYYGTDSDPFQQVKEWWNTQGNSYTTPSQHLLKLLNVNTAETGSGQAIGKGWFYLVRKDPKELVLKPDMSAAFTSIVAEGYEKKAHAGKLQTGNYFLVRRGPYVVASVMEESVSAEPLALKGNFIDLFDPLLPLIKQKSIHVGEQGFLFDINQVADKKKPQVLAAASRESDEKISQGSYSFITKSPEATNNVMRILLPAKPVDIKLADSNGVPVTGMQQAWDEATKTLLLQFKNRSEGVQVNIRWK
ncbi:hypothetical protein [Foetidibacter luteolus]|uniref:hypothetical protein n=1 Tax=Foetidibacter luteolus TaxID=2608880 RepID=UPI00129AFDBF|nr:hypothetical protein [Foetidibacter luteolus]